MIARLVVPAALVLSAAFATAAYASVRQDSSATDGPGATTTAPSTPPQVTTMTEASTSTSTVDPQWVRDMSARTGVAERALEAYAATTLRLGEEQPGCRLGWTTLAGIGRIESGHGRSSLDADGRTTDAIEGPELDGTQGFAAIEGDDGWDRARGPMQFIDSTWQRWASDGDGDGVTDVDDIDDAAYAAGRYLCHAGGDLSTPAGWTRAIFAYNHSDEYVQSVLAAANDYAARSTS